MTTTTTISSRKAWAANVTQPGQEFGPTPLTVLSGQIPAELRGSLYRNGPGRLSRGQETVGHWFDGDGAILAVHFRDTGPEGLYRYVQTRGYQAEEQANRYLFGNYGMTDPQGVFHYWRNLWRQQDIFKNAANTSVMALPDRLLALWEGGQPHALDLETLATWGLEDFDGELAAGKPFTAHPLRDPLSGEIYSIGIDLQMNLNLYRLNQAGKLIQQNQIKLSVTPFCHSFCLAGNYLIFFLPPITLAQLPLLFGQKAYADALGWNQDGSTQVLVVDRDTLQVVSRGETDPWFQWHYGNGCLLPDGNVRLDLVHFPDFIQTNEYLREIPSGVTHTASHGRLWQVILNPRTAQVLSATPVWERFCEFPIIDPRLTGQPWQRTYVVAQRPANQPGTELFGAIACFDYDTETITEVDLGPNKYPMEPLFIPHPHQADQGWLMTVVYDGDRHQSEVWIWGADHLDSDPLCRLGLPAVIPYGFHGTWRAA